ncbi:bile acid:sodium symporter family protein [Luteimonas kalidii]|uniref:Bile acid:sodium symporter n=1 Tax=Luteimonas kalidii TaxID=3042025 RepID=A0ABT6JS91_9GAMM|nr:bile acid:sodium symporter [Luteimonas kalidii]MDH5833558.1 bile acid:sodium symporter [Luteimonas kalidii]
MEGNASAVLQMDALIRAGLPSANFLIMLAIGMGLAAREFARVAREPGPLLVGIAGQYLLLPLLGFGVAMLFRHSYELAVGFILLAASPSASSSNALTYLARGNLALAVTLTAVSALLTLATIPLLTGAALQAFAGQSRAIPLPVPQMMAHLVLLVALPLLLGMALRHLWPRWCERAQPWLTRLSLGLLLVLIACIAVDQREALLPWIGTLALATAGMCLVGMCGGYLLGHLCRLERRDAITIGIETGIQNCTLAFLIAYNVLESATMAMPPAVYGIMMYAVALCFVSAARANTGAGPRTG